MNSPRPPSAADALAHPYRSHTCSALRLDHVGRPARLSGWVHRKRDHGHLLFIDLRDHYGMTQCVIDSEHPEFEALRRLNLESVITVSGMVVARSAETVNPRLATGDVELRIDEATIRSVAEPLPFPVSVEHDYPEEMRLRYRFLDLRREWQHAVIQLRSNVIASIRRRMLEQGFLEIATPILTSTSPEGARDYLVPSRNHPGRFYALPQAPQIFKQLLMVSGFDRYFQIAPCFRDEAARADRSPGEFYQLDLEMAFVEQDDVFATAEPVLQGVFEEFGTHSVSPAPFVRLRYADALLRYGTDKPDLRNPLVIADCTETFRGSDFAVFSGAVDRGAIVRAIPAPGAAGRPRSFFDKLNDWALGEGARGLGYVIFAADGAKGPIAKRLSDDRLAAIRDGAGVSDGDAVFFVCDRPEDAVKFAGVARTKIGEELDLIEQNVFRLCWIVDFPMFERNPDTGLIEFSHNPFSMPQGGMEALQTQDPLTILAYQYDVVCNGVELGSGAIRNHLPEVMLKAFEIGGYERAQTEEVFGALLRAFRFGAPPHGGMAPGIDRIVMLLGDLPNIREGICFPMTQQAEDLMMGAPSTVTPEQLKELHVRVVEPKKPLQRTDATPGG